MNHCHFHGSQKPSSVNVKQALPLQCAVPFEALAPSSIMVGPTEASPLSFSSQAPTEALANAMPVEVLARVYIEEIPTVPVEALPNVYPIVGLTPGPLKSPDNVRIRALAPVWPTPSRDPRPAPSGYQLEPSTDCLSAPSLVKVAWSSVEPSGGPIPSVNQSELGPDGPSASDPSPAVNFGWPYVEPSICPCAFPSSSVRRSGNGSRRCAVAPVLPIPAEYPAPNPGVSPLRLGLGGISASGPSPTVILDSPSVEPDYAALNNKPASSCDSTGHRRAPSHDQSNWPWDRPSEGPNWEPSGYPSVGPSGIPIPSASCDVPMAPRDHSLRSNRAATYTRSDRRLFPQAEAWTLAKCIFQK
jgi:hypothetical protein